MGVGGAERQADPSDDEAIAAQAFAVLGTGRQIPPFTGRFDDFDLRRAYRVTAAVRARREARGERPIGRKIGFTNRTIWAEYDVHHPIWGYVYDGTVRDLDTSDRPTALSLHGLAEPRIEPEIIFGLERAPAAGMSVEDLFGCIAWIAHGFEIVQSIFPGWRFSPADTVAAYGLHGALLIGPRHPVSAQSWDWLARLTSFRVTLSRSGAAVDHGTAANVLDGPVFALRHLVDVLATDPVNPPLAAGEIVTTGTLTRAFPVAPGEVWRTELDGVALEGAAIAFTP